MIPLYRVIQTSHTQRARRIRIWLARVVWPVSLVLLLIASWPHIRTTIGAAYLIIIDLLGIAAGWRGVGWIEQPATIISDVAEPRDGG